MTQAFLDEPIQLLERFAQEAVKGCGLSDLLWQSNLNAKIESHAASLPAHEKQNFLQMAQDKGYYCPHHKDSWPHGLCTHGLDPDTCPCGCFEY